jgi:hypothetical protein
MGSFEGNLRSGSILQIYPDTKLNPIVFHPCAAKFIFIIQSKCRRRNLNFTQGQQQSNYSCDHYKQQYNIISTNNQITD